MKANQTFKATCIKDCKGKNRSFKKGKTYRCEMLAGLQLMVYQDDGTATADFPKPFDDYFETDFKINELPFPIAMLSDDLRDKIYRDVWCEHVKADVCSQAEENDIALTDEQADNIVHRYVYEGDYDCNCSYWANIESLTEDVVKNWAD